MRAVNDFGQQISYNEEPRMVEMTALERLGVRVDVEKAAGGAEAFARLQRLFENPLILEQGEVFKANED